MLDSETVHSLQPSATNTLDYNKYSMFSPTLTGRLTNTKRSTVQTSMCNRQKPFHCKKVQHNRIVGHTGVSG